MLTITLEGSSFERGFQHGQKFAQEIQEEIRIFCPEHWLTSSEVKILERRLLSSLATQFPDLVIEMIGISKGSGTPFDRISLLNLVLATNDLESDAISSTFRLACSAIGFPKSDVGPLVGKNCDDRQSLAPFYLFQRVYPENELAFMGISTVGTVWLEGGMNEAGLAMMQTAGPIAPDQTGYGIACNIAPRPVLARCRTTADSISMLKNMFVAGWGMGLIVVDEAGDIANIEKTGDHLAIVPGLSGAFYCTNHFTDPSMDAMLPIAHQGLEENSKTRHNTLKWLFEENAWPQTLHGMKGALGYHGEAGFVCQHGETNLYSNYSCIAMVKEKKALVGDGYPCRNNYQEFTFSERR